MTAAAKTVSALPTDTIAPLDAMAGPALAALVLPTTMMMGGFVAMCGVGYAFARAFALTVRDDAAPVTEPAAAPSTTVAAPRLVGRAAEADEARRIAAEAEGGQGRFAQGCGSRPQGRCREAADRRGPGRCRGRGCQACSGQADGDTAEALDARRDPPEAENGCQAKGQGRRSRRGREKSCPHVGKAADNRDHVDSQGHFPAQGVVPEEAGRHAGQELMRFAGLRGRRF